MTTTEATVTFSVAEGLRAPFAAALAESEAAACMERTACLIDSLVADSAAAFSRKEAKDYLRYRDGTVEGWRACGAKVPQARELLRSQHFCT